MKMISDCISVTEDHRLQSWQGSVLEIGELLLVVGIDSGWLHIVG